MHLSTWCVARMATDGSRCSVVVGGSLQAEPWFKFDWEQHLKLMHAGMPLEPITRYSNATWLGDDCSECIGRVDALALHLHRPIPPG